MRLDQYKLIFWDFDGVIKESIDVKTKAFVHLFDEFGSAVKDKVRNHHLANGGMSRFDKLPLYLRWTDQEEKTEKIEEYSNRFSQLVFDGVINSDWVPGSEAYLRLNSFNQRFVLVSATPQKELELILERLDLRECFSNVFGAPESKKDAIAFILESTDYKVQESLMIGDALADMEAAEDNEITFLLRLHEDNKSLFSSYIGNTLKDFSWYE
jgi:phosphoglycolate phosphatase-like HAD superfamily hydrolase